MTGFGINAAPKKASIFSDGGCRGNHSDNNIGGYGVYIEFSDREPEEIFGSYRNTTNNKMEMKAVIEGLKFALKEGYSLVEVLSDSAYVVNCINNKWYKKWMVNGWVTSNKSPVENRDLWIEMIDLIEKIPFVTFTKVKGHSTNEGNNRADLLVNKAMDLLKH